MDPLSNKTDLNHRRHLLASALERAESLLDDALCCDDGKEAEALREQAVLESLELANSCARRYHGRGVETEDLIQIARAALVKAAHGYSPGKGSGFAAYASSTIRGEIKHYFRDCSWAVRPPRRLQENRQELVAERDQLRQVLRRDPTIAELSRALSWDPKDTEAAQASNLAFHAAPLDSVEGGSAAWVEGAMAGDDVTTTDDHLDLVSSLQCLSPRERLIVQLRFVQERTQAEIGTELGVSQMQVSRLLAGILSRLRTLMDVVDDVA